MNVHKQKFVYKTGIRAICEMDSVEYYNSYAAEEPLSNISMPDTTVNYLLQVAEITSVAFR